MAQMFLYIAIACGSVTIANLGLKCRKRFFPLLLVLLGSGVLERWSEVMMVFSHSALPS